MQYYKSLDRKGTGPDGKPLSPAELRVMKQACFRHNEAVWCCFEELEPFAEACRLSKSHCRKIIAKLERRNLLWRYEVGSVRGNMASVSSEIELPDLLRWLVREGILRPDQVRPLLRKKRRQANRDKFFREVRVRRVAWLSPRGRSAVRGTRENPVAGQGVVATSAGAAAIGAASSLFAVETSGPAAGNEGHPHAKELPSKRESETKNRNEEPSVGFLEPCGNVEDRKASWLSGGRSGSTGDGPAAGAATRREAERIATRERLDGLDAALWDEAERVLVQCGFHPTRRQRNATILALQSCMDQQECPPAAAGDLLCCQWQLYRKAIPYLRWRYESPLKFFRWDLWDKDQLWPWVMHPAGQQMPQEAPVRSSLARHESAAAWAEAGKDDPAMRSQELEFWSRWDLQQALERKPATDRREDWSRRLDYDRERTIMSYADDPDSAPEWVRAELMRRRA